MEAKRVELSNLHQLEVKLTEAEVELSSALESNKVLGCCVPVQSYQCMYLRVFC